MPPLRASAVLATVLLLSGSQIGLGQGADPGFGGPADVAFALRLWEQLQEARLVGANAIGSRPMKRSSRMVRS